MKEEYYDIFEFENQSDFLLMYNFMLRCLKIKLVEMCLKDCFSESKDY